MVYKAIFLTYFIFFKPSTGPPKKGKPTSAAGGKTKKTTDNKEVTESELSVSVCAYTYVSVPSCYSLTNKLYLDT